MARAREITVTDLKSLMEEGADFVLFDVRETNEYAKGHIPGAVLNPSMNFSLERFPQGTGPDTAIYVCCAEGSLSKKVVAYLSMLGYKNASTVKGGFTAWQKIPGTTVER